MTPRGRGMSARIITDRAARPTCLLQAVNRQLPSASSETCSADGTSISGDADFPALRGYEAARGPRRPSAVSGTSLANVRARAPRRRELCSSVDALRLPSQIGAAPDRAQSALVGRPKRYEVLAGIELAPAAPSAGNQGSDPIGRDGPTTDSAAGLATGDERVHPSVREDTCLYVQRPVMSIEASESGVSPAQRHLGKRATEHNRQHQGEAPARPDLRCGRYRRSAGVPAGSCIVAVIPGSGGLLEVPRGSATLPNAGTADR